MESPSAFGQTGIGIQDCTLPDRELRLASALALASLAGLAGAGTTGDMTGTATASFSITIPTIAGARTSIMVADFMVEADFRAAARAEIRGSMDQHRSMVS